jgi:hypothetical protein
MSALAEPIVILVWLAVAVAVVYAVWYVLSLSQTPQPLRNLIVLVVGLIAIALLLSRFGVF